MNDPEIGAVQHSLTSIPRFEQRVGSVMRAAFDQIYYGQKTGRYHVGQLYKTEKAHIGSLVEINLRREFDGTIADGMESDYQVAGVDVDCKFSLRHGGWMIPTEARGRICLLAWAEDTAVPRVSMGLVRATDAVLNKGLNKDGKTTLSRQGLNEVTWLIRESAFPANALLQIPHSDVERILSLPSGQQRIDELFRSMLGHRIGRAAVATVARQEDYMKSVRGNGGARSRLRGEGIVILGDYRKHRTLASSLGLPVPENGEFVAVRLEACPAGSPHAVELEGKFWRQTGAKGSGPAPLLPSI